jgi:hypothetical protein
MDLMPEEGSDIIIDDDTPPRPPAEGWPRHALPALAVSKIQSQDTMLSEDAFIVFGLRGVVSYGSAAGCHGGGFKGDQEDSHSIGVSSFFIIYCYIFIYSRSNPRPQNSH